MEPTRTRTRLLGVLSILLALVLIPLAVYVLAVLEPQRRHMIDRNMRVLAEAARELEKETQRLTPLIQFTLIPRDQDSDQVAKLVRDAEERRHEAEIDSAKAGGADRKIDELMRRSRCLALGIRQLDDAKRERSLRGRPTSDCWELLKSEGLSNLGAPELRDRAAMNGEELRDWMLLRGKFGPDPAQSRDAGRLEEAAGVLTRSEAELSEAKRVEAYLNGLRKTREYRAIWIQAKGDCPAREQTVLSLERATEPVKLVADGCRSLPGESPPNPEVEESPSGVKIRIKVPLADLAAPLDEAASVAFDQLVIASDDGRVLHASPGGPILPADRLDRILRSAQASGSIERLRELASGGDATATNAKPSDPSALLRAARSRPLEVEIGQTWYQAFAYPLKALAGPVETSQPGVAERETPGSVTSEEETPREPAATVEGSAPEGEWYVVGIVRDARFTSSSLASSRSQLALAISGLVLLLLACPWLRLLLSGPRERIGTRHVLELVTSLALGVGLLTLLVADRVAGTAFQQMLDDTAEDTAGRIEASLRSEIQYSVARLHDAVGAICWRRSYDGEPLPWQRGDRDGAAVYPPYDVAFALDARGEQVAEQANYRTAEVSRIKVPERPYFTHVRDGKTWKLRTGDHELRFFLQRINTYDHGWKLTAVSAPLEGARRRCKGAIAVALTRRFDSVNSTVLPPGFGFAVVEDATGEVVYHSDDRRSVVENFLTETGSDPGLASLIRLRRNGTVEGRYRTEGAHRFTVHPLRDIPWTLVVFERVTLYDALHLQTLLAAGAELALYVIALLTVGLLTLFLLPRARVAWLWPDEAQRARYVRGVVSVALIGVLQFLAVLWLRGTWLLLPIAGAPALALGAVYLTLQADHESGPLASRPARPMPQRVRWSGQVAYLALLLALLAVTVVGPSLALFKDVQRAELDRLTRYGQRMTVLAVEEREKALRDDAARLAPERFEGAGGEKVKRSDAARWRGLYVQPSLLCSRWSEGSAGCRHPRPEPEHFRRVPVARVQEACSGDVRADAPVNAFSVWLTRQLPAFGASARKLRHLFDGGAVDGSECWLRPKPADTDGGQEAAEGQQKPPPDRLEYLAGGFRFDARPLRIPRPRGPEEWGLATAGVGGIAALATLLLWLFGTRVLGLGIRDVLGTEVLPPDADVLARNRLVLFPPRGWSADLAAQARAAGRPVALLDASADPSKWPVTAQAAHSLLIVDDLHRCLLDPPQRELVLAALEEVASHGGHRLILCSDVHPLDYLRTSTWLEGAAAPAPPSAQGTQDAERPRRALDRERLRWGSLLEGFRPTRIDWTPPDPPASGDPRLVELLCQECDWTPWLAEVREDIANDPRFQQREIDARQLVHWVAERAEPLFRRIWALTPTEDRLSLIQLASGDLLNPRNDSTIERLMRRGLLRRDPRFRPVSRSFALFARRVERPERVHDWERGAVSGTWDLMRVPLAILFLLILGFAVYAGRDTVDATLALIPALAAGFPTVVRVLGSLRVASTGGAGGSSVA